MAKKKILHLIHDDKFFDATIELFDSISSEVTNVFLCILYAQNQPLKFITKKEKIIAAHFASDKYLSLLREKYDTVIIHYLLEHYYDLIFKINPHNKITWFSWGGDFYRYTSVNKFQPKTKDFIDSIESKKMAVIRTKVSRVSLFQKYILRYISLKRIFNPKAYIRLFNILKTDVYKKEKTFFDAIQLVDYCASVFPNEFEILKSIKGFRAKQIFYTYPFKKDFFTLNFEGTKQKKILVGNSYTWECNHVDVFYKLKELEISEHVIITPLSYGLSIKDYPELPELAKKMFGKDFIPIVDFMPIEEYSKYINECRVAIFNHEIQQAGGNVVLMIYLGAKVFLSENNPIYHHMKKMGVHVFSFQNQLTLQQIETPLSADEVAMNRQLMIKEFEFEAIRSNLISNLRMIE